MDLSSSGVNTCQAEMNGVISCLVSLLDVHSGVLVDDLCPAPSTRERKCSFNGLYWLKSAGRWENLVFPRLIVSSFPPLCPVVVDNTFGRQICESQELRRQTLERTNVSSNNQNCRVLSARHVHPEKMLS